MEIKNIYKEIRNITYKLIDVGLADEFRFPIIDDQVVAWSDFSDISISMKNLTYKSIYDKISSSKNFNFKLPDGGIFQLLYTFDKEGLSKHRLAYFPSPSFEEYQNNPTIYDNDEIYGDVVNKQVMPVIIRIDYNRIKVNSETHHPYSHLTLGQYKNCRIPVEGPLTPNNFISFILENFYHIPNISFLDYTFSDYVKNNPLHISEIDLQKIYFKLAT